VNGILNQMKRLAGICFQVFHHYFVLWTSPRNTSLLCGTVTDLIRGKAELVAENALLYQQLIAFVTRSLRTDVPSSHYTVYVRTKHFERGNGCISYY